MGAEFFMQHESKLQVTTVYRKRWIFPFQTCHLLETIKNEITNYRMEIIAF